MNYDELVKSLRTDHDKYFARDMEAADAIAELSRRCEQFQYMPTPAWISVKERLPEERTWVLCECRAKIKEVLRWQDGGWYHDPQHRYMSGFVTHWMPLPAPPREGKT